MRGDRGTEILLPYQREWVADGSRQKISEKSRRVGISWAEALNSVLRAAPREGAVSTYYLSYNRDMTRQFIRDCAQWAERLEAACSAVTEEELLDGERAVKAFRIDFASGAEICALPSEAYVLRSKKGRVVFDEAAFCRNFDGVIKAAQALLIWGGQLSVISTHNGEDSPFNALVRSVREGRDTSWSLHRTTFREAVAEGLYKRICLVNGTKWSARAQDEWVARIYDIYRDNAAEELDVIPSSGSARYFPRALLDSCARRHIPVIRWDFPDSFLYKGDFSKNAEITRRFRRDAEPLLQAARGLLFFGLDFARSGDLSVLWCLSQGDGETLDARFVLEVRNCPFREQEQAASLFLRAAKSRGALGGMAVDSRGNGQYLAENLSLDFPGAVEGVMETPAWYAEWFPKLKALMETEGFTVPDDLHIISDFSAVTLRNGSPHIPDARTRDRDGKNTRHGDGAASALLACYAVSVCAPSPPPVFAAAPQRRRRGFFGLL